MKSKKLPWSTLALKVGDKDEERARDFLQSQVEAHVNSDCEFPGFHIEISHHHLIGWEACIVIGSRRLDLDQDTVIDLTE